MLNKYTCLIVVLSVLMAAAIPGTGKAEKVDVNVGADFYSRYIWRGLDIGSNPSIQPSLTAGWYGLELGIWGAYAVSTEANDGDEIDSWLAYAYAFENGASIGAVVTSYYFPNGGEKLFDFAGDDAFDEEGNYVRGAHTVEWGLSVTGPEKFPLTLSGYINVYNDRGHNTYYQLDYPFSAGDVALNVFVGAAGGSGRNPDYYGTSNFNVTNVGITAVRDITVTDSFTLPVTGSFIVNPHVEISYLIVGITF